MACAARRTVTRVSILAAFAFFACTLVARVERVAAVTHGAPVAEASVHAAIVVPAPRLIPTRYAADRFYAIGVTPSGDTIPFFLDTGGGTLIFSTRMGNLQFQRDSITTARGKREVVAWPAMRPESGLLPAITNTVQGDKLMVAPSDSGEGLLIAKRAVAQLGTAWFGDRVWTFDFPAHRFYAGMMGAADAQHRATLGFRTDSTGHRLSHSATIGIDVGGDSLNLIFDTGAAVWLTPTAEAAAHDGLPAERATSFIRKSIFDEWRVDHPGWRVIEHADSLTDGAMIEVPVVHIAGYTVGPVWFTAMEDKNLGTRTTPAPSTPVVKRSIDGTLGGSALRYFRIVLDYPASTATFHRPIASAPQQSLADSLIALEKRSWIAWQARDSAYFHHFISKDHADLGAMGPSVADRIVKFVGNPICVVKSYSVDSFTFTQFNATAAMLNYRATQDTSCGGNAVPSPAWVSSLFILRDGRWQNAAFQETPAR